ncbi:MAG: alpha-ketoacid dehydrogenase subunit beta [Nitrososphaerota archaeon]|nr:alpha-ketoacid dehydrogenase subunit beta [Nitrososphaerota archaeon]MDG6966311.1 alpha-ketoacid dehydrogenase subunit beta [Nitrososphaerota archaeon]MDG6977746.1 alpha-ketoacid dehydrogenase subunit beta [Nitrososphaerota archaeon]MDG7022184.1 alpha-ketoacid dehydrogenase subunit beta [Nitrososphaerota archaeon]
MPMLNLVQSVNETLRTEMRRNADVVLLGEDIGKDGGVFRATAGLLNEFGPERVMDTPIAEDGIIGTAIGMALYGLEPVVEIQFLDFIYPGFNQIVSELAKIRYRSGGGYPAHVVIRAPYGGGIKGALYHSQSTEAYFTHTPGLYVVTPSTPADTMGLLRTAIRGSDPVMFLEPKRVYRTSKEEVPADEDFTIPFGKARVVYEGTGVTLVSWGAMVHTCKAAAEMAAKENISVELIDMRTLMPFDLETVLGSVRKTGRVVIAHEATKVSGFGGEIAAQIAERAIDSLRAPIVRLGGFDTPFPYALENRYLPSPERVLRSIRKAASY